MLIKSSLDVRKPWSSIAETNMEISACDHINPFKYQNDRTKIFNFLDIDAFLSLCADSTFMLLHEEDADVHSIQNGEAILSEPDVGRHRDVHVNFGDEW